jgi:hypothetical protein
MLLVPVQDVIEIPTFVFPVNRYPWLVPYVEPDVVVDPGARVADDILKKHINAMRQMQLILRVPLALWLVLYPKCELPLCVST